MTNESNGVASTDLFVSEELDRLRSIRTLVNHWARPSGPRSYYWYLTFENTPELHALAMKCQQIISFPYYDLTPPEYLHLTLDRVAYVDSITRSQLSEIEGAARSLCAEIAPFEITLGLVSGTPGAIGFTALPVLPTRQIRDQLRTATLSLLPEAPVSSAAFHAHVALAYCNADGIPADDVKAAADSLNTIAPVTVKIEHASLVLLERHPRSYTWSTAARVPLTG